MNKPVPDPIIADYVAEVSVNYIPYVSTSHNTLFKLTSRYGQSRIQMLLNEHWAALREWHNITRGTTTGQHPPS